MYLCLCKGITESKVREVGPQCAGCPELLAATLGIDDEDCCRRCIRNMRSLIEVASHQPSPSHP